MKVYGNFLQRKVFLSNHHVNEVGHPRRFTKLSHTITDKRIRIEVWLAKTNGHKPVGKWVKWSQLRKLPLAGAHLKILALMNEEIADKARVC